MPIFLLTPLLWTGAATAAGYYAKKMLIDDKDVTDGLGFEKEENDDKAEEHVDKMRDDEYKNWARAVREGGATCEIDARMVAKGGLPHETRAVLWMRLSGGDGKQRASPIAYENIPFCRGCSEVAVLKDIGRTLPKNSHFKEPGGKGQQALEAVLRRFSSIYPHGYTQSMNVVAGFLLSMGCSEEQTFWILDAVVQGERYSHDYYTDATDDKDGLHQCREDLSVFDSILLDKAPQLVHIFADSVSLCYVVCLQWVLCIFVDCTPSQYSLIIFDLYMLEGLPFLYNLALLLLLRYQDRVMCLTDIQEVVSTIRDSLRKEIDLTPLLVEAVTSEDRLTHDTLKALRESLHERQRASTDEETQRSPLVTSEREGFKALRSAFEAGFKQECAAEA